MARTGEKRIGLLGGTFDPPHMGHLILAQDACEKLGLDRVIFIPSGVPAHKKAEVVASAADRLAMARAAVRGDRRFSVSDIETRRAGVSYTVDTVASLCARYPACRLFFIVGSDALLELHLWRDIYRLMAMCRFAVFRRPGPGSALRPSDLKLRAPWPERLVRHMLACPQIDISSTALRRRVAEGRSIKYLVPPAVERYIAEQGLYSGRSRVSRKE